MQKILALREFGKNNLPTFLQIFLYLSPDSSCVTRYAAKNLAYLKKNLLRPLGRLLIPSSLIVTIFILSTTALSAQVVSKYIDSLERLLPEIEHSIEKIQLLSDLSQEYIYWEDYEHGKHYAYEAIALAKLLNAPPSNLETPLLLLIVNIMISWQAFIVIWALVI